MFCAIIPVRVKGLVGWGLDKPGELMSNSLISTDNSSAIQQELQSFCMFSRNIVDFFTHKYEIMPYNLTFPNKAFAE